MKKKLKIITLLLLVFLMAASSLACNNTKTEDNPTNNNQANNASAVELLNKEEKSLYNILISKISSFKDPKSLVLTEVTAICNQGIPQVKISATNGFGGTSIASYYAFTKFYTSSNEFVRFPSNTLLDTSMSWLDTNNKTFFLFYTKWDASKEYLGYDDLLKVTEAYNEFTTKTYSTSQYNISRINAALKEYKQSMGWL